MTNKLVVIINSLKVPKIKKILIYEIKFLVPNYSCIQNPWLVGHRPQIPVLSVLCLKLNLLNPPPAEQKFLDTPLEVSMAASATGISLECVLKVQIPVSINKDTHFTHRLRYRNCSTNLLQPLRSRENTCPVFSNTKRELAQQFCALFTKTFLVTE